MDLGLEMRERMHIEEICLVTAVLVATSILLRGVTATPWARPSGMKEAGAAPV